MLVSQMDLFGKGNCGGRTERGLRQFRLMQRRECAPDNSISIVKSHLTGGNAADLIGNAIIDLISNYQESEQSIFGGRAEVDRLQKHLVKMLRAVPPAALILALQRGGQGLLC